MTSFPCTKPRTILILGTGYLGQALADGLRKSGHTALTADINQERAIYDADLTNEASIQRLQTRIPRPDAVIICASTKGGGVEDYKHLYEQGTQNVLKAFPGIQTIFCSSTSVYGITDGRWITEEHNVYPNSDKRKLLLQAEQAVLTAGGIVLRMAALYGPGRCKLISRYRTKGLALPGGPKKWMNYIHRDDAVAALMLLCTTTPMPSGIYNLTDRTPMQLEDIYTYLSNLQGSPMPAYPPLPAEARRGTTNQRISCARLLALGWEPLYPSFADGVHNVLEALEAMERQ